MTPIFAFSALVFLALAYFVGIKKQTWLLSGYNQQRVRDKDKLAKLVGSYSFIVAIAMAIGAFIDHPDVKVIFPIMVVGYVILLVYVNTKMVE
ncbi:DUF3784 domain-containing protein [Peribacillus simplex]|uniref:DUF3784 domain-containing protein n=1 Tax=Peribacillus simplex TaxID=1478 RepID=UPI000F635430|nr:DUF3784 domain-containing protein [Peribacillus simplex]RRN71356.1 DUF3784 domain-containing protein [Peribacillus simplex]